MGTVTSITAAKAKTGSDNRSSERTTVQWITPVLAVIKAVWPVKTAQNLAHTTQVTERAAAFWLAGQRDMSLDAARALLRSEHGYEMLAALMGDSDARWWKRMKLYAAAAENKRALNEQAKKLERLRIERDQLDIEI
jgi:hypothetical protein